MDHRIGQGPFLSPTVFNFYLPEYVPYGPVGANSLVSPEAQLLNSPLIVGYLNGIMSLVDNGLTRCQNGFGEPIMKYCSPMGEADGHLNFKPTDASDAAKTIDE